MNDTVTVALITAASTLLGASLTGFFTLTSISKQLKTQVIAANYEREEQRTDRRREIRRESYMKFMNELQGVHRKLRETWMTPTQQISEEEFKGQIYPLLTQLRETANLISLEGPSHVQLAASNASRNAHEHAAILRKVISQVKDSGTAEALLRTAESEWEEQIDSLISHSSHFLSRAQIALGNNTLPEMD